MINVPASIGELVDKITVLKIKSIEITDADKLKNITKEYDVLTALPEFINVQEKFARHLKDLLTVNYKIWFGGEDIRRLENDNNIGEEYLETSRMIFKMNDKRSKIKKEINILCNSELIEEKSYKD